MIKKITWLLLLYFFMEETMHVVGGSFILQVQTSQLGASSRSSYYIGVALFPMQLMHTYLWPVGDIASKFVLISLATNVPYN